MRHYIRYSTTGELVGVDVRSFGWADGVDPNDPDTTDKVAKFLRSRRSETQSHVGWVAYECPCPRSRDACKCPHALIDDHHFNGHVLFPKPELTVLVNGLPAEQTTNVVPGSDVAIKLLAATPEGHKVTVTPVAGYIGELINAPEILTFSGGESNTLTVVAPQQGITGSVTGRSNYVRRFNVALRGWA